VTASSSSAARSLGNSSWRLDIKTCWPQTRTPTRCRRDLKWDRISRVGVSSISRPNTCIPTGTKRRQPRQTAAPVSADYRREPSFDEASVSLARTIRDEKIDQGDNSERDQGQLVLARNGFLVWSLYAAKPRRWWRRGALTGSRTHASLGTAFSPRDHRLGHGCHRASTSIGPVATASQREGVEWLIAQGSAEGVGSTAGGRRPRVPKRARFIEPTVFTDADNSHHEIFGPVLSVIPYTGHDAAVKIANDFKQWPSFAW
jgi:hypothetical protein